jgi:hypothetical protein
LQGEKQFRRSSPLRVKNAAEPWDSIFAKADVGNHKQVFNTVFYCADSLLDNAVGVKPRSDLILVFRYAERITAGIPSAATHGIPQQDYKRTAEVAGIDLMGF